MSQDDVQSGGLLLRTAGIPEGYAYRDWWERSLVGAVEVASFILSRRMLGGIRSRSEGNVL